MSYILDALKKADAERAQGSVPGLHTQVTPQPGEDHPAASHRPSLWIKATAGGAILAGAVLIWQWPPSRPAGTPVASADKHSVPVVPVAQVAPIQPVIPRPLPAAAPASAPTAPLRVSRTTPRPPVAAPAPTARPRTPIHVDPADTQTPAKVPALADLPEEVRRELPPLAISGAMYSDTAANRMLLINNRVFHEGDQPAPELTLEQIRLKSAVFRFRQHRYAVSY